MYFPYFMLQWRICTEKREDESKMNKHGEWFDLHVPKSWNGLTIEHIFKEVWQVPKTLAHEWRMEKSVLLNQEPAIWTTVLQINDRLSIQLFKKEEVHPEATYGELTVCYEDDHVLVVNKPVGMNVHPAHETDTHTLANIIAYYFTCEGVHAKVRHIHRLDQETSGVILFAKHRLAGAMLDKQLAERKIERTYIALVHGKVKQKKGTIKAAIGRDRHNAAKQMAIQTGQNAITHYKVLKYDPRKDKTLVQLQLETGRTHQIRVHLAHIGHPIVGDTLYEGDSAPRLSLHANQLSFIHPFTGESISCTAEVQTGFKDFI